MAKIDPAASNAASESRMGRPTDLTQSDIEALAAGGKAADKVRKKMDSYLAAAEARTAADVAEDGKKAAPAVKPPAAEADIDRD